MIRLLFGFVSGLSPRLRGNVAAVPDKQGVNGSIPALAGERPDWKLLRLPVKVYPRACGGTSHYSKMGKVDRGLSPRLRGNGTMKIAGKERNGSIPALAGERCSVQSALHVSGVYPRACGGTLLILGFMILRVGLSPRLRGNV